MSDQTHDPWKRFDNAIDSGYDDAAGILAMAAKARAADAQTIATLQDENARLKAEVERLQKFKNAVAAELCVENEHGPVSDDAIVSAAKDTLAQLFDSQILEPPQ